MPTAAEAEGRAAAAHSFPTFTSPSAKLWLGLVLLTLFRLWAAATIPLTEDEAYYRLWAASPQFGYFDHPPMIAWWIAIGRRIAGDTPLGVRLLPVIASLVVSLLVLDLAVAVGWSVRIAERAALWCNATLLIGVGGVLAVPDAASVPFWTLTLCCLARTRGGASRPAWPAYPNIRPFSWRPAFYSGCCSAPTASRPCVGQPPGSPRSSPRSPSRRMSFGTPSTIG
jgi:4-amino-4-deoxy-L-arabinose transferase-like glycosyltransferase